MFEQLLAAILALTASIDRLNASRGAPAASAAPAVAAVAAPAPAAVPGAVTMDTLRLELQKVLDAKGRAKVVELFASVGAQKLSDIKPSDYGTLQAKITAELAAPAATDMFA